MAGSERKSSARAARSNYQRSAPLVHGEGVLRLNERGELKLAIVSDTHGHIHPHVPAQIRALAVDAILHAGDIGDLSVLERLRALAPLHAVRGNIDERASDVPDVLTLDVRAGDESVFKLLLLHIAVYGPKLRADAARLAYERGAKLVVCGHSHVPFLGRDRGLTMFNPGSIGPRRMHLPIVFGVLAIAAGKLSLRHIDAETGRDWSP